MKTVNCGMIVRCYLMVLLALSAVILHGQNKTVINIGEGSGSGSVGGQDSIKVAIIQHREADGVDYPNIPDTVAWKAKLIDTEVVDEIGVSIVGDSSVSIPDGKYLISFSAFGPITGGVRLYNNTATTTLSEGIYGVSMRAGTGYLIGPATISIQYWLPVLTSGETEVDWPATTLGTHDSSPDDHELYSEITIIKLQ